MVRCWFLYLSNSPNNWTFYLTHIVMYTHRWWGNWFIGRNTNKNRIQIENLLVSSLISEPQELCNVWQLRLRSKITLTVPELWSHSSLHALTFSSTYICCFSLSLSFMTPSKTHHGGSITATHKTREKSTSILCYNDTIVEKYASTWIYPKSNKR